MLLVYLAHFEQTFDHSWLQHYNDIIMSTMVFQITSLAIVYSIVYSGADQRKHQSSLSLALVRGINRWPANSPHKGPVARKIFPFDDIIMIFVRRAGLIWSNLFDRNKILSGGDLSHYQVPHCIRVFFYFVWFVFIHQNFQFYFELCTYCNILDI